MFHNLSLIYLIKIRKSFRFSFISFCHIFPNLEQYSFSFFIDRPACVPTIVGFPTITAVQQIFTAKTPLTSNCRRVSNPPQRLAVKTPTVAFQNCRQLSAHSVPTCRQYCRHFIFSSLAYHRKLRYERSSPLSENQEVYEVQI